MYSDRKAIHTQFTRKTSTFTVRKWREKESYEEVKAKEAAGIDTKGKEVKVSEEICRDSEFDKIIDGQRNGINVIHEDEKCLVIADPSPIA